MAVKTKSSKGKPFRPKGKNGNPQSNKPTILGLSPERIGVAVASAVIGEVLQIAMNRVADSDLPELKQTIRSQLDSIGNPVKGVMGVVKDAIADVTTSSQDTADRAKETVGNSQDAIVDTVNQGVRAARGSAETAQGQAQDGAADLLDGSRDVAESIRQLVVDRSLDALHGAQRTTDATRHALGDTAGAVKGTANATQGAVALVIGEAIDRVRDILTNGDSANSADNKTTAKTGKKGKKGKKNKKGKKGKK